MRLFLTLAQCLCVFLPLGGCAPAGDLPQPNLVIPASYANGPRNPAAAEAALPSLDWWRQFRSPELTAIIEETRVANLDIAAAAARIVQADAQARITGAALLPVVNLLGDTTRLRTSGTLVRGRVVPNQVINNVNGVLNASFEIDFWGKNRAALIAAEETAVASRFDREVVGLSTVVSAANAYFQVLAARDRLKAARDDIVSATRVLELIKQRVNAGAASALDTAQQESVVYTLRAAIPVLQQVLQQNRIALAVLMARSPEQVRIRGSLTSIAIPRVTPGLPSKLLTQRPDIRQAEANLAAANANVYNARAQFLPTIALTGDAGYSSAVLKLLTRPESAIFSAVAGLAQPIFEGGRLHGNLDLQKGVQDELLQDYRKAVISAFGDVEIALDAIRQTTERVRLQQRVVKSSREAFKISEGRLREGTIDLVTVLQTQQALFEALDTLAQTRLARLQAVLGLYKALGGGWESKPPQVEASTAR